MSTRKLTDTIFRVVDLETTGLNPEKDKIVEVAWVEVQSLISSPEGEIDWEADETYESLVDPQIPIPPVASAVHHLVDRDVAGAETWEQLRDEALPEDEGVVWVAHNAAFDAAFVGHDPKTWLCTKRLASHAWPEAPAHGNQVLRYWLNLNVHVEGLQAHRALGDAQVTAQILIRLLKLWQEKAIRDDQLTIEAMLRRCWSPILQTHCRFGKHGPSAENPRGTTWDKVPTDYLQWMMKKDGWDEDLLHTVKHQLQVRGQR